MANERDVGRVEGSYRTPSFEHAVVSDAMRAGVISCPPDASLQTVARMMATHHVHSLVVTAGGDAPLGVVSERQLLEAAGAGDEERTADQLAADPHTVFTDEPLPKAAETMLEAGVTHLLVVDSAGRPIGVLSALDIAGILGWGLA
jgi:CBS domain-containing protein